MAASAGSDEGAIVGINITPMVDIMLVLLIIFMITTNIVKDRAIEVELPEAATGETVEKKNTTLGLSLTKDLVLYLNGEEISEDGLRDVIRAEKADPEADINAIISADRTVQYGEVTGLIDLIKQEGVFKFALNIDPVPLPAAAQGARAQSGEAPAP